jgi:homoaconitase/3-isopropylmalate dehydratase large subunit
MSICNMSIEAGARAGMIAPDDVTIEYLRGRPLAPKGVMWERAVKYWEGLRSDDGAFFDKEVRWKTNPIPKGLLIFNQNPIIPIPVKHIISTISYHRSILMPQKSSQQ